MGFKNIDGMTLETGSTTTNGSGSATVVLNCFTRIDEIPCVTVSSYDVDGNSNVNSTNLSFVGLSWQVEIITSAPNIKVFYHAFKSTKYVSISLVTQDLFEIITQNNEQLILQ